MAQTPFNILGATERCERDFLEIQAQSLVNTIR